METTHTENGAAHQPHPHSRSGADLATKSNETVQVVEFLLGKEHFAIDLFDVKEVVEYTRITKIPNTLSCIRGIIDLRGEITTIVDLKEQLNIIDKSDIEEENSRIIVLDDRLTRSKMGIMVDDVLSVSTYSHSQVDNAACETQGDAKLLGIIKKKTHIKDREFTDLVIWIDIRELLRAIDECVAKE